MRSQHPGACALLPAAQPSRRPAQPSPTHGCLCLKKREGKLPWGCSMALPGRGGGGGGEGGSSAVTIKREATHGSRSLSGGKNLGLGGRVKIRGKAGFVNNFHPQQQRCPPGTADFWGGYGERGSAEVCACRALKETARIMDLTAANVCLCEEREEPAMLRRPFA